MQVWPVAECTCLNTSVFGQPKHSVYMYALFSVTLRIGDQDKITVMGHSVPVVGNNLESRTSDMISSPCVINPADHLALMSRLADGRVLMPREEIATSSARRFAREASARDNRNLVSKDSDSISDKDDNPADCEYGVDEFGDCNVVYLDGVEVIPSFWLHEWRADYSTYMWIGIATLFICWLVYVVLQKLGWEGCWERSDCTGTVSTHVWPSESDKELVFLRSHVDIENMVGGVARQVPRDRLLHHNEGWTICVPHSRVKERMERWKLESKVYRQVISRGVEEAIFEDTKKMRGGMRGKGSGGLAALAEGVYCTAGDAVISLFYDDKRWEEAIRGEVS